MAEIKIYGTFKNDTGEPIASSDQIIDPATGKMVSELLGQGSTGADIEYMTDKDVADGLAALFPEE